MQFDGNVRSAQLREEADAHHILTHELHHAGSAQAKIGTRCGLQVNGEGLQANEGMTEYLTQLSMGAHGIERAMDGSLHVHEAVPYRGPVLAMLALHEQFKLGRADHFAVLFNAYHGEVGGQAHLEQALDEFYRYDHAITRRLNQ